MPVFSLLLINNWYFASYGPFAYTKMLSISGSWFIRLSIAYVSPDPEPPIINALYGCSGIYGQFGLYSFMSSFVI